MKRLEELLDEIWLFENVGRVGHLFAPSYISVARFSDFPIHNAKVSDLDLGVAYRSPYFDFKFIPHAGKGLTPLKAVKSALGEALERTLPLIHSFKPLLGKYSELGEPALGPGDIPLFAPQQRVPFKPFTEKSYIGWVRLEGGERPLVPAQIVVFGYRPVKGEELIGYSSSGGLSTGVGLEAIYRGALEFVERDAVNLGWHSDIPPYKVKLTLEEALRLVGARPKPLDYKLHVFLWRTDVRGVYVVTAHLLAKRSVYAYMPGGGAGFTFEEALAKALGEIGQAFSFMYTARRIKKEMGGDSPLYYVDKDADPSEADNLFRVVWYWGYEENLRRLYEMFFQRAKEIEMPRGEGPERLSHRLSLLPPYYWYEYKGAEPLKLVKVFIPSLTQYNAPRWPMFGHPRYYKAKAILGICDCEITYEELRKIPVPYP
ncbi:MAG: YcaO-like family protein [Pyrobaculum sp.]|jgi:hypothetical protein|uniref:YcaO-like family protein n=2 Tax=Pyrobaculum sp. TaxID=2004705 RepID=UPI0031809F5B